MNGSIVLSKKYGVNPAIPLCFFCLKPKNEIILAGLLRGKRTPPEWNRWGYMHQDVDEIDIEAPKNHVWDRRPCAECEGFMAKGIILISVDESKSKDHQNPYRSGGWCVVTEDLVKRVFKDVDGLLKQTLRMRVAFLEDAAWDKIGLPRGDMKNEQSESVPTNS